VRKSAGLSERVMGNKAKPVAAAPVTPPKLAVKA